MMLTKLKFAALLLSACLVAAGAGLAFSGAPADGQEPKKPAQQPAQPKDKKAEDKKGDPKADPKKGGNNEPNGGNNQNGNNEQNGQNNQNGNDEKNGNNNQNGNNEPNGQNNQNGNDEQGVVKAVDLKNNTITVAVKQQGKQVEKVFALPKNVPVKIGG